MEKRAYRLNSLSRTSEFCISLLHLIREYDYDLDINFQVSNYPEFTIKIIVKPLKERYIVDSFMRKVESIAYMNFGEKINEDE